MKPSWWVWTLIGLLAINILFSVLATTRPMVPVSALTVAIASLGGDVRVVLLRTQQLEQALQQAAQENERLREELKKAKGGGK